MRAIKALLFTSDWLRKKREFIYNQSQSVVTQNQTKRELLSKSIENCSYRKSRFHAFLFCFVFCLFVCFCCCCCCFVFLFLFFFYSIKYIKKKQNIESERERQTFTRFLFVGFFIAYMMKEGINTLYKIHFSKVSLM